MKPRHVEVLHVKGNPHDRRLNQIGLTIKGTWSRRKVRTDEDGDWYILLDGLKWYLDDPDTNWVWVD